MENNRQISPTLMQKIMEDDDSEIRAELEQRLQTELAKPEREVDYALVEEITEALCTIYGMSEVELARGQEKCIARLFPKQNCQKRMINKWIKPLAVCMIGICSLLFVAHLPIRSLGVDLISEVVDVTDGSATLLLDGSRNAHLQPANAQKDPLSITDELETLEIPAFVPSYATDRVEETYRSIHTDVNQTVITAWYQLDKGSLVFSAMLKDNTENMKTVCSVPTKTYQFKEEECNGIYMITLEEEDRYHVAFAVGDAKYLISMYGVDFSTCRAIIESISTEPLATASSKKESEA